MGETTYEERLTKVLIDVVEDFGKNAATAAEVEALAAVAEVLVGIFQLDR